MFMDNLYDGVADEVEETNDIDFDDTAEGAADLHEEDDTENDDLRRQMIMQEQMKRESEKDNIPNDVWKTSRLRAENEANERYQKKN